MMEELRKKLTIPNSRLESINRLLLDPDSRVINDFLQVVARYGTPEEINRQAAEARQPDNLRRKLSKTKPEYLADLDWLIRQRDAGAFIGVDEYRHNVLGNQAKEMFFDDDLAVTLEVSACQYFPWLMAAARRAIERRELMPGRFIRVRKMREQEADGDLPAFAAAMTL